MGQADFFWQKGKLKGPQGHQGQQGQQKVLFVLDVPWVLEQ
jgi:hypothetical protein